MGGPGGRKKSEVWKQVDILDEKTVRCRHCGFKFARSANRIGSHLGLNESKGIRRCTKFDQPVRNISMPSFHNFEGGEHKELNETSKLATAHLLEVDTNKNTPEQSNGFMKDPADARNNKPFESDKERLNLALELLKSDQNEKWKTLFDKATKSDQNEKWKTLFDKATTWHRESDGGHQQLRDAKFSQLDNLTEDFKYLNLRYELFPCKEPRNDWGTFLNARMDCEPLDCEPYELFPCKEPSSRGKQRTNPKCFPWK